MALKGGYKIIDLKGLSIDTDAEDPSITVDGIYEAIEGNYKKPLLFSGLVLDTTEFEDFFAIAKVSGDDYVVTIDVAVSASTGVTVKLLTIDDDDKVTYSTVTYVAA